MAAARKDQEGAGFPVGGGKAGQAIRDKDWSNHPLGPPDGWSPCLKGALGLLLNSPESMFLAWGPQLHFFYNDAYEPIMGPRSEGAMGAVFSELWSDAWPDVSPIVNKALAGEASRYDAMPVTMNRFGQIEETWWAFSYSPIRDEAGAIPGMFCLTNDVTPRVLADRARAASDRQLQVITDALPVLIAFVDRTLRYRFVNQHYEAWFGKTREEVLSMTPQQLLGDDPTGVRRAAAAQVLAGETVVYDSVLPSVTGPRSCEVQYVPRRNREGDVDGFYVLVIDVTERDAAIEALSASEARFRGMAEATPGFVWTAGPDGQLDYTSPRWHEYAGSDPEASKGDGWINFVHPDDVARALEAWRQAVTTGQTYEVEFRLRNLQGRYRWWLGRALPIRGEDGEIRSWSGLCTELQEIVEARETLARSREELEQEVARRTQERDRVWNNSRDLLVVAAPDGTFHAVSPAWTKVLGYEVAEVLGRNFRDFVAPDDVDATHRHLQIAAHEADVSSFENRYLTKGSEVRWISWHTSVEGELVYAYGRDITGERAKEDALALAEEQLRQAQKMEAVGQLTGGIAHDFNNLLTGVIGSLDMMQRRIAQGRTAEIERFAGVAMTSARRAAALTHRLLAFSRRQPLDARAVNANRLVAGMEDLIRRTIGEQVVLETVADEGLWLALCDPHQLESAILNLAINARDAMPDGGVLTIAAENARLDDAYIAAHAEARAGDYVCITVADTGEGMTPEVLSKAFDPFFTTKAIGEGTGLGLSMVYGFARQSDGHVRIYSEPGKGARIELYLPRHEADGEDADDVVSARDDGAAVGAGQVVLVVEDEHAVRGLVVEVLHDLRCTALEAADGPEALRILQSDARIDLMVTDVGLPGLNGRLLADAARAARPDLRVLFMTGYAEEAATNGGFLVEGMALITKPFAIDDLSARIREILAVA